MLLTSIIIVLYEYSLIEDGFFFVVALNFIFQNCFFNINLQAQEA